MFVGSLDRVGVGKVLRARCRVFPTVVAGCFLLFCCGRLLQGCICCQPHSHPCPPRAMLPLLLMQVPPGPPHLPTYLTPCTHPHTGGSPLQACTLKHQPPSTAWCLSDSKHATPPQPHTSGPRLGPRLLLGVCTPPLVCPVITHLTPTRLHPSTSQITHEPCSCCCRPPVCSVCWAQPPCNLVHDLLISRHVAGLTQCLHTRQWLKKSY